MPDAATAGVDGGIAFDRRELPGRVELHVEGSADLVSWQNDTVEHGGAVSHGDGTEAVVFRSPVPQARDLRRYFRVRAVLP